MLITTLQLVNAPDAKYDVDADVDAGAESAEIAEVDDVDEF